MSKVEFGDRLAESTHNFSAQSLNHQSQAKIQAKGNFDTDIAIIGAGVHALTLTMHLLQKRQDLREKILVFDPSGDWLTQWHRQFAAQEIPHLRSPIVHHPDPNPFALRRFAETHPNELFPPYDLPSTKLFRDFCQNAIASQQLSERLMAAKVISLEPILSPRRGFRLGLSHGKSITAKRVVLATNNSIKQIPHWVERIAPNYPSDRLVHSSDLNLASQRLAGETILIVGGGLTSGHLALGAIARGAKVLLLSRRQFKEKLFDADAGWLGPKYLKGFHAETNWEKRREMVLTARDGGSMTPSVMTQLRREHHQGRLEFHPECEVAQAQWHSSYWQIACTDGMELTCDHLWLATGTRFDAKAEPLLHQIMEQYPQPLINGFPILDEHLRWHDCELFIMGGLAALRVGPTARNISGARMASDRIVPALTKSTIRSFKF
ncbi:FAD/NAD(P)-binding protein [Pseudanabaena sp. ABRG5-3]|uniref:FAD/NAD(P)-binding protein n=1 Tax=Pseudanabaena sp. ABRG5-3 TaxID=685565 RepID=UPI000DC71C93|nr:FAD/NAD(P)-binding protein [Pseudanabaena sp. ABRG5-3]BBC22306.1 FAD-dependent oxidoreductase [Pseudanabaena sp. ABRG5-3]